MTDTKNLDTSEKVDILLKSAYGFPSADETRQWYEETAVKFNNSINGEDILVEIIPNQPDFDTNGTVRTATDIGLNTSDFINYSDDYNDRTNGSIVDDSTGTVRRYKLLILEETPQLSIAGSSWFKLNSSGTNVIQDSFQFNFKQYVDDDDDVIQPYLYKVNTEKSLSSGLPFGKKGGNYFIDLKSGVLFFSDFINFSNGTQTDYKFQVNIADNKPVLTIYSYIGKKGIQNLGGGGSSDDITCQKLKISDVSSAIINLKANSDPRVGENCLIGTIVDQNDYLYNDQGFQLNQAFYGAPLIVRNKDDINLTSSRSINFYTEESPMDPEADADGSPVGIQGRGSSYGFVAVPDEEPAEETLRRWVSLRGDDASNFRPPTLQINKEKVGMGIVVDETTPYKLSLVSDPHIGSPQDGRDEWEPIYWYGSLYCGQTNGGITMGRFVGTAFTNCIQSRYDGVGDILAINPFGGNVGIGTSSPYSKLTVGLSDVESSSPGNNQQLFTTGITAKRCYIGIGKQEHLPKSKKIIGFGYIDSPTDYYPAYIGYQEMHFEPLNTYKQTRGDLIFGTRESGSSEIEPTERMRITSSGIVVVNGQILISKAHPLKTNADDMMDYYLRIGDTEYAPNARRLIGFGYTSSETGVLDAYIGTITTDSFGNERSDIIFGTDDVGGKNTTPTKPTEKMRITYDGKVGIGTDSPGYKLEVNGNGHFRDGLIVSHVAGDNNRKYLYFGNHPSVTSNIPYIQGGGTSTSYNMALNPFGGNVGIGTDSPGEKLEVNGDILVGSTWGGGTVHRIYGDRSDGEKKIEWHYDNPPSGGGTQIIDNHSIGFSVNSALRMKIISNGNVGIGTTSPRATFNVSNNLPTGANIQGNNTIPSIYGGNSTTTCVLGHGVEGETQNYFGLNIGTTYTGNSYFQGCHTNSSSFYKLFLNPKGGNVGIGQEVANYKLDVNGSIGATGDITAYYSSDKRLKNNITPIQNPLEKLEKINGYTFDWIEKKGIHSNKGKDIGIIAQEVEDILPEITTTRDNGYKAVRYEKLTPFLISCIKEQQQQIESQQQQINELKEMMKAVLAKK